MTFNMCNPWKWSQFSTSKIYVVQSGHISQPLSAIGAYDWTQVLIQVRVYHNRNSV